MLAGRKRRSVNWKDPLAACYYKPSIARLIGGLDFGLLGLNFDLCRSKAGISGLVQRISVPGRYYQGGGTWLFFGDRWRRRTG